MVKLGAVDRRKNAEVADSRMITAQEENRKVPVFVRPVRFIYPASPPASNALEAALHACAAANLPPINVTPNQGKLLQLLATIQGAKKILEIGTLGGYSTIWLARALPASGWLLTLEINAAHAAITRANVARAGLTPIV